MPEIKKQIKMNAAFAVSLACQYRFLFEIGGRGSGKSHFVAAQKILMRLIKENDVKHRFLCLRKTRPAAKKSIYELIWHYINELDLTQAFVRNQTELSFTARFGQRSEIICSGLDDPGKTKSMEGVTGIWMEEATEFAHNDLKELNLLLRGETASYKQVIASLNPISKLSWIYKDYVAKRNDKSFIHNSTYLDNAFIDEDYKKELESLKDQNDMLYQIYALGEWGVLENTVYSRFNVIGDEAWPKYFEEVIYGLDFGYNNPTALVKIGFKDGAVYERQMIFERKMTNEDLLARLEDLCREKKRFMFADSAEPARIEEICRAGFNCLPSNKSVKDGIDYCKRLVPFLHCDSVDLIKEYQSYSYKKNKNGDIMDEPVKFNDHLLDAKRYAEYTYHLMTGHKDDFAFSIGESR